MKYWNAIMLGLCLGVASVASCTKERPAEQPPGQPASSPHPGAADIDVPRIPIDQMPKLLSSPVTYPEDARKRGDQGIVYVKALVSKEGVVTLATVEPQQSVSGVLGKAAVDAVKNWRFEPALSQGKPVEVWIVVPVSFKLN